MMRSILLIVFITLVVVPHQAQTLTPTQTPEGTPPFFTTATPTPLPFTATPTRRPTATITPTPRPDVPDFIFDWQDAVLFPTGIYFKLVIDRPLTQIQDITLTLSVDGETEPRVIPFEILRGAVVFDAPFTEIQYIWNAPPNDPPPFQAVIRYTWTVVTSQQEIANIPGVLAFRDSRYNWVESRHNWLNLLLPENTINPEQVHDALQPIYTLLQSNTGRSLQFSLLLTNESYPINPCNGDLTYPGGSVPCRGDVIEGMIAELGYSPFHASQMETERVIAELTSYLVTMFYDGVNLPAWFINGLTYFYAPTDKRGLVELLKEAARTGRLYTLNEMQTPDETNRILWDAQSYSMVVYIARLAGVDAVFELARGGDFATRYQEVTGLPFEGLLPSWENYIFRQVAMDDANLSLYAGATDLPTATNTVTPFPPTATDIPTNTPTNTPTPTVTGVLSATPLPSLTSTLTPRPGTPTITPLPAGFVFPTYTPEPSPTPLPTQADAGSNSNVVLALAVAIISLAIVIVGYIRFIRDA
ncbi:MAG: hypothetical protein CUN56_04010 [Phototrophicales bacterium]|nr:MAG: hypothetical protein CUN56_04010 [Phototrophicales bacterium]